MDVRWTGALVILTTFSLAISEGGRDTPFGNEKAHRWRADELFMFLVVATGFEPVTPAV